MEDEKFEDLYSIMLKGEMTSEEMKAFFWNDDPFSGYAELKWKRERGIQEEPFMVKPARLWRDDEIEEYAKAHGWESISASFDIKWDLMQLRKYKDKIHWRMRIENNIVKKYGLSDNDSTFLTEDMIDEFNQVLDFRSLSHRDNIQWGFDLLKRYIDRWAYNQLGYNKKLWNTVFQDFKSDSSFEKVMNQ